MLFNLTYFFVIEVISVFLLLLSFLIGSPLTHDIIWSPDLLVLSHLPFRTSFQSFLAWIKITTYNDSKQSAIIDLNERVDKLRPCSFGDKNIEAEAGVIDVFVRDRLLI